MGNSGRRMGGGSGGSRSKGKPMRKSMLGLELQRFARYPGRGLASVDQTNESAFFQSLTPARLFRGRIGAQSTYLSQFSQTLLESSRRDECV